MMAAKNMKVILEERLHISIIEWLKNMFWGESSKWPQFYIQTEILFALLVTLHEDDKSTFLLSLS